MDRRRLFFGICLALIPTGASFALVSNILVQLKQQFILTNYQVGLIGGAALWGMAISLLVMGPLLEGFGLKNGARLAFLGHLAGITLMIAASSRTTERVLGDDERHAPRDQAHDPRDQERAGTLAARVGGCDPGKSPDVARADRDSEHADDEAPAR